MTTIIVTEFTEVTKVNLADGVSDLTYASHYYPVFSSSANKCAC